MLQNFGLYYDYEREYDEKDRRKIIYHILKEKGEYQPIPNKRAAENRNKIYDSQIIEVIQTDNVQTAANVARIISKTEPILELKHKEGTVNENTRSRMRELFGTYKNNHIEKHGTIGEIIEKRWCRLDHENNQYVPMSNDQISSFLSLFKQNRENTLEMQLDIISEFTAELITREEMNAQIGSITFNSFVDARNEFKAKYGFTPIKVPVFGIEGIHYIKFEKEEEKWDF